MSFRFDVIALFPDLVRAYASTSILGRALRAGTIELGLTDPRDYTDDRHRTVDDHPHGGGAGMVMKAEPIARAVEDVRRRQAPERVVLASPAGRRLTQDVAAEYARLDGLAIVCGRYEGVDERVAEHVVDEELSLGDFVITGGELTAMAVIDAVSRQLPAVLGNAQGAEHESFTDAPLLEHPQYTRPRVWRGHEVPPVLLSGDHGAVEAWRRTRREERTRQRRPDLWARYVARRDAGAASPNPDDAARPDDPDAPPDEPEGSHRG